MASDLGKASADMATLPLPPTGRIRWSAWRKVAVLSAIRAGKLTFRDARERYELSQEELNAWQSAFDEGGIARLLLKYQMIKA